MRRITAMELAELFRMKPARMRRILRALGVKPKPENLCDYPFTITEEYGIIKLTTKQIRRTIEMTRKMTRAEAAWRLEEIAYEIYDKLKEVEAILGEVAPEELETARVYWMAHIDGALFNRKGWMRGSFVSLEDTLTSLEEDD